MTLEDSLRVSEVSPPQVRWPDEYTTPYPPGEPNWRWADLWEQENPRPEASEDFEYWYSLRKAMRDRVWVAWVFPQFRVFDWNEEDVKAARTLIRGHTCSVCGRSDDPGCIRGC